MDPKFTQEIFNSFPTPFLVIDIKSNEICLANKVADEYGKSDSRLCYQYLKGNKQPCSDDGTQCVLHRVKESLKPVQFMQPFQQNPYEEEKYYLIHGYPVFDTQNNLTHVIEHAIDITDRIQAENELKKQYEEVMKLNDQIRQDMEKAKQIHLQTLPPREMTFNSYQIHVHFQPARDLGGDFYHVLPIEQRDQILFYLTDISGHGLDCTLLTMFTREVIHSYINLQIEKEQPITAYGALQFLNQKFQSGIFPPEYFITIFLGIIDCKKHSLQYNNAGFHVAPLFITSEKLTVLPHGNIPISLLTTSSLMPDRDHFLYLQPGSTLLLHTDGLIEEEFYCTNFSSSLQEILIRGREDTPQDIVHTIMERFHSCQKNQKAEDDITILILQRLDE